MPFYLACRMWVVNVSSFSSRVLLSLVVFHYGAAYAQSVTESSIPSFEETSLDVSSGIVVTGTKTEKSITDSPIKTDVLTEKDLQKSRYRDLSEAILDIPGVTLGSSTGKTGSTAIMQGMGGDRVLILMDGVPLAQNSSGGFDLSQIPATDIQRIEVVKGGASALYGGQAMGGVIHIVTKQPKKPFQYKLNVLRDNYLHGDVLGENDVNVLNGQVSGHVQNTAYKFSATRNRSLSVDMDPGSVSRDTPDLRKFNGNVWIEQSIGERHKVNADYTFFDEDNTSYFAKLRPNGTYMGVTNSGAIATHRMKLGHSAQWSERWRSQFFVFSERVKDELVMEDDPNTAYQDTIKTSRLGHERAELQIDYELRDHLITFGVVADHNRLDQANQENISASESIGTVEVDNKSNTLFEGYVQDDWTIGNKEIVSGIRYTRDEYFGDHFTPKLNMSYSPQWFTNMDSVVRASVGSGYRIPSLKERFYVLDHRAFAGYIVNGNENLLPEKSLSYQLGVELTRAKSFSTNVNVFVNSVRDMVTVEEVAPTSSERRFSYVNVGEAWIQGAELSATYFVRDNLRFHHSFTYTRAEDKDSGLIVVNRPFYVGQSNVRYQFLDSKFESIFTVRYFGESYATTDNSEMYNDYFQSDIRLNYKWSKNIDFYVGGLNIFNAKRAAVQDALVPIYDQRPSLGSYIFFGIQGEG